MDVRFSFSYKTPVLIFVALLLLCQMGCKPKAATNEIDFEKVLKQICEEFKVNHDVSYLVLQNGREKAYKYEDNSANDASFNNDQEVEKTFLNPILLDISIRDSLIAGDSSLNKYFPAINNKEIKVKDLVIAPADNFEPERFCTDSVYYMTDSVIKMISKSNTAYIDSLTQKVCKSSLEKKTTVKSVFRKLAAISNFFDQSFIEYAPMRDSLIENIFPTWYTENKMLFYGWEILKFQKNTILWNCFTNSENTMLLMKFMDQDVFAAFCYKNAEAVPTPYSHNHNDILQSPIALALIKSLLIPKDERVDIDYEAPWDSINAKLNLIGCSSPFKSIYIKDLLAHQRYYNAIGDTINSHKLYNGYRIITGDSLLVSYINKPPIAETGYISDNLNMSAAFSIKTNGFYQIYAGGQVFKTSDYITAPYQYDNVQIYFSEDNNGETEANQLQMFQFNYKFDKIAGLEDDNIYAAKWLEKSGIKFSFSDPDDTSYLLEVAIPWKEIKGRQEFKEQPLLLNILLSDSDYEENKRESVLSWATKPGEQWYDPSTFGCLFFKHRRKRFSYDATRYTYKIASGKIIVDGQVDRIWDKVDYAAIEQLYYNQVSSYDHKGKFKSLYDKNYLYFLFNIGDNSKNKTGIITKDKCWIENASTGELIWKLPADTTSCFPSYSIAQKIYLKAGNYYLRYLSDGGYSFEKWIGKQPRNDIYGCSIYKVESHD